MLFKSSFYDVRVVPSVLNSIMLCWKLEVWYICMHTHVVLENILLTMIYNFDSSQYVCFSKKLAYLGKNSAFTQGNTMRAVLENLLVLFSVVFFFFFQIKYC